MNEWKEKKKHECPNLKNYKGLKCKDCEKRVIGCADSTCCYMIDLERLETIQEFREKLLQRFRGNYKYNSKRIREIILAILKDKDVEQLMKEKKKSD